MASIVKELDKVSGTTTRSHNIADAVSKLKTGGGGGGGELTVVNATLIENLDEDDGTVERYVDLDMPKDEIKDKLLAKNNVVIHFGDDAQVNGRFANSVCHLTKMSIPTGSQNVMTTQFITLCDSHILVIDNLYDVYIFKLTSEPGYSGGY